MPQTKQHDFIHGEAEGERHDLPRIPSRPFDFFIWLDNEELDAYVESLATKIDDASPDRKARPIETQKKFIFSIKLILLNLLAAEKSTLRTLQAIPLRNDEGFNANTRYRQKRISYRSFIPAYEGLVTLRLVKVITKGHFDKDRKRGKVTRIEATHRLKERIKILFPQEVVYFTRHPDEENIRLRNTKKTKPIEYVDTDYTITARNNLEIINTCLNQHWYDLRLSNEEFDAMYQEMAERHKKDRKKHVSIRFSDRSLYRVFNNGDIPDGENFKQGGRFYGGWWEGIPSKYRQKITIDDKPTVEVDYSGYHPRMLYAQERLQMEDRDVYLPDGLKEEWRDFGKLAFTKLLNGKKLLKEPNDYEADTIGMTWKELLARMEQYHEPISKYFRTGYGLDLQRKDSDIAEAILLKFAKRNIPCLPVHDSFIVHHAHADELKTIMEQEYAKVFEQGISTKIDNGFQLFTNEYTGQSEVMDDIDTIIKNDNDEQYSRRFYQWLENKE